MLQNRNLLIVLIAVALGLAAVYLTDKYLVGVQKREAASSQAGQTIKIAVASTPLPYGAVLTSQNIELRDWPATSAPPGAFRTLQGLVDGKPRVTFRPLEQGEPVLPGKISGPGGRASVSELIDADKRAVAVRINDVAGVAGLVLPGDRVDVLVTHTPVVMAGMNAEPVTDVLLQNVRVVAIDQNSDDKSDKPQVAKAVTLAVDPASAQKLALAGQIGTLSLALRNAGNAAAADTRTIGTADLRAGGYAPQGWAAAAPMAPATGAVPGGAVGMMPGVPARPRNTVTVQVVRGVASANYEVKRHGRF